MPNSFVHRHATSRVSRSPRRASGITMIGIAPRPASLPKGSGNGHGMHVGAHPALAPGMCERFEVRAVVGLIDRVAGAPEPRPERALGTDKAEVSQEMGANFLAEKDGGYIVHPAVREELGVVSPVVQVRHQRGAEVHVLAREQQLQIVGRESGDAPVVEMEVVVGGTVTMSPRVPRAVRRPDQPRRFPRATPQRTPLREDLPKPWVAVICTSPGVATGTSTSTTPGE